jgi:hypothetical protein
MIPTPEELGKLNDLTRMTGSLTNVQIQQLKMWPKVILGADAAEVEFDPENYIVTADVSNLDYKSMMEGSKDDPVTLYNIRMAKFDACVKYLLGDDYGVVVKLKGAVIGRFPPKRPPIKAHEGRE